MRHKFASEFLQATGDLAALQAILGHRSVTMTIRHAHMVTDHLHAAMRGRVPGRSLIGVVNGDRSMA
ncbi:MAG: tyrosine-type recombinase/integrase [Brevundimonas sp.]